jgi:hypothetical protein
MPGQSSHIRFVAGLDRRCPAALDAQLPEVVAMMDGKIAAPRP